MVPGAEAGVIGILDIDMGNLRSVSKAVDALGHDQILVGAPGALADVSRLIIPGVGSYRTAMEHIDARGLRAPIRDFAGAGKPVLGICLGMQLLSAAGEEGGPSEGLGLVPGRVSRMRVSPELLLPHVGWNTTHVRAKHPVFKGVKDGRDFYYVHSYEFHCDDAAHALATSDYGREFTAIVGRGNVIGFQFHPEKSQANGLRLLDNFCGWDGAC